MANMHTIECNKAMPPLSAHCGMGCGRDAKWAVWSCYHGMFYACDKHLTNMQQYVMRVNYNTEREVTNV